MKTIKKSILSLLMVCTILMGSLAATTVTAAAASPQLNLVRGQNCFNVVWNKVDNAAKYRLYFGANCRWRRYTDLALSDVTVYPNNTKSVQFLINSKALTGRYWAPYGEDKHISTSSIKTTESYCCQVEAFDSNNKHLAWTNVGYVYFGTTTVKAWTKPNSVGVSWNTASGSNTYQVAYRYGSHKMQRDKLMLGAGLDYALRDTFDVYFHYDAEIAAEYANHLFFAGFNKKF